jgi:protocatechuate 3,4-dioxygenase beta subunit
MGGGTPTPEVSLRARPILPCLALLLVLHPASGAAPPAQTRTGIAVGGRVEGADGSPLAGARVSLLPVPSSAEEDRLALLGKAGPDPVATASTGPDGAFRLAAPAAGMWKVRVEARGLVPREFDLVPLLEETELPAVKLERDAGLELRVTGLDGSPLAGARVWAGELERSFPMVLGGFRLGWRIPIGVALTDAKGAAVLPRGARQRLTVRAGVDGQPYAEQEVRGGSATLRLPASTTRQARVLDPTGKKPVPGVYVHVGEAGWCAGRTSADGLFAVPLPAAARRQKVVLVAEDGRRLETWVEPPKKDEKGPQALILPALEIVAGRVVSALDGRPVAGALVWGRDPGAFRRSGADGGYRIEQPPGIQTWVQAAAPGYFSASGEGGQHQGPTLALEPALAVGGVVVDEAGRPVAGVEVRAMPQMAGPRRDAAVFQSGGTARTSPAGRFRVGTLAAGVGHDLRLSKTGFAPGTAEIPPLEPGRPAPDLRLVLRQGRTGFGRIVNQSEEPVAGAQVTLSVEPSGDMRSSLRRMFSLGGLSSDATSAVTGADGRFEIRDLPAGTYVLAARSSGYAPLAVPGLAVPEGRGSIDLGTLILAPGVAVEGYVVDPQGRPVAGAEVKANEVSGGRVMRFLRREDDQPGSITGQDGFFRIEDRRAGETLDLDASRAGYAPASAPGVRVPPEQPVRLVLQPASAVEGRVRNTDGEPVAGASLVVLPSDWMRPGGFRARIPQVSSDESGFFRLEEVPPGVLGLRASATGYQAAELANLEVRAGQDLRGVEVVLAPGATIEGRVLSPSGRPVVGAEVMVVEPDTSRPFAMPLLASTDGDGRYRLEGISPGARTLQADHEGYRRAVRDLEVRLGENTLDLTLEGGVEVRGRVVDDGGVPVPGVQVSLREGGRSWDLPRGVSGPDGSFTLAGVADGTYRLLAEKEGFAQDLEGQELTVAGSSLGGIEVKLTRGGAIAGQLLGLDFNELAQVQVRSERQIGAVKPDGSYRIENVGPGSHRVVATVAGGARQADGRVELEPGAAEARLDLDFGGGFTLTGRVLRNGEPLTGETVVLNGASSAGRWSETDHEGRFRFEGLEAGSYDLGILGRRSGAQHTEKVEVTADRDLLIELRTAAVSGRVTDAADRSPLANAAVALLSTEPGGEGRGAFPLETTTDSRGVFLLRDVAEGSWKIRASLDGYAPVEMDLQTSGALVDGVDFALQATEGVSVELLLPSGRPPSEAEVAVLDPAGRVVSTGTYPVGEGGRVRLSSVAPGSWELLFDVDSAAPLAVPVTAPGDAGRVILPPPGSLSLKVPALAGARVGARVRLDSNGKLFRTVWGSQVLSEFELQDGTRELQRIPPGAWNLTVTADDGRIWKTTATVVAGGRAAVRLE